MYTRSVRQINEPAVETAPHVGPGYYSTSSTSFSTSHGVPRRRSEGFAPFGSLRPRETIFAGSEESNSKPPPGSYNIRQNLGRAVGGSSLSDRVPRFRDAVSDVPPVGSYDYKVPFKGRKDSRNRTFSLPATTHAQRVVIRRKESPASIPSRQEVHGYEQGKAGLTKAKPAYDTRMDNLGPGRYNIEGEQARTNGTKYKGSQFSKGSQRKTLENFKRADFGPSPADYAPQITAIAKPLQSTSEARGTGFKMAPPRFKQESHQGPTATSYTLSGSFDSAAKKSNRAQNFLSQTERFKEPKNNNPAPGSYNDPRTALNKKVTKSHDAYAQAVLSQSPFMSSTIRFQEPHPIRNTPGPNSYTLNDIATQSQRKAQATRNTAGFCSTGVRTKSMLTKDNIENPGPGSYDSKQHLEWPKPGKANASFQSRTSRGIPTIGEGPAATTYNNAPSNFKEPPSDPKARTAGSVFNSTVKRSVFSPKHERSPGPNSYDPALPPRNTGGRLPDHERHRFKEIRVDAPPSTQYDIRNDLTKPSHNVTF